MSETISKQPDNVKFESVTSGCSTQLAAETKDRKSGEPEDEGAPKGPGKRLPLQGLPRGRRLFPDARASHDARPCVPGGWLKTAKQEPEATRAGV